MATSPDVLSERIKAFYPEIAKHDLSMQVTDDTSRKAWAVEISKGGHKLKTYVDYADAEGCVEGKECVHLSTQIGQFIRIYCKGSCPP
ncbi:hypothetical protein [Fundidesulfovibrio terrae]|uniref:hypothetical protein n=1 Tax=Fundidesulfovibrio terrae TaxID=2922866 RepID=UPI001FAF24E9|nr:hypothetical protein [Fundidesulfovibrio terrae]